MSEPMAPGDEAPEDRAETAPNLCPDCGGSGRRDGGECATCDGTGEVQQAVGGG
jgi:DnaJ-class molecular chaperone